MPHIVSLIQRNGHICGATIVHKRWLLTAGHCVCNGLNRFMKASQIRGVVAQHSISEFLDGIRNERVIEGGPYKVDIRNIVPHPNYECTRANDDIALLELATPLEFSKQIKSCCIYPDDGIRPIENEEVTVAGWGWTLEDRSKGDRADTLLKAQVRVWNNQACENSYRLNGRLKTSITDKQMCAGYEKGGIDSCWADSGGPLITHENYLIGVVSTGFGCARPGLPGIYTRASKYLQWMDSVVFQS